MAGQSKEENKLYFAFLSNSSGCYVKIRDLDRGQG